MILPRKRLFWAVSLGHITNDTFISMGPVLLTFLSATLLPMTNTQIGLLVSTTSLVGALSQPFFGLQADRTGGRWLGTFGVAWTVTMLMVAMLVAQTGEYWLMFIPFVLPALGSGAFHPVGAMYAAESDRERAASNLSVFFLLGQMGLALGPALAGILLDRANAHQHVFTENITSVLPNVAVNPGTIAPIFVLIFAAIPSVILMGLYIPPRVKKSPTAEASKAPKRNFSIPMKAMGLLIVMVALRSLAQPGSVGFIPILFRDKGWSPSEYGLITSSFWIASGLAGVFLGNLADIYDRRLVVAVSLFLSAPAFFFLPLTDGVVAFALAMIAGGLSGASHSIIVVIAQEMIPASKGFASGAILGLIFGAGALGSFLIGGLSDAITLTTTFQLVAILTVIASIMGLALPAPRVRQTTLIAPSPDAQPAS